MTVAAFWTAFAISWPTNTHRCSIGRFKDALGRLQLVKWRDRSTPLALLGADEPASRGESPEAGRAPGGWDQHWAGWGCES